MMIYLSREFLIQNDFPAEINPLSSNILTFHWQVSSWFDFSFVYWYSFFFPFLDSFRAFFILFWKFTIVFLNVGIFSWTWGSHVFSLSPISSPIFELFFLFIIFFWHRPFTHSASVLCLSSNSGVLHVSQSCSLTQESGKERNMGKTLDECTSTESHLAFSENFLPYTSVWHFCYSLVYTVS